MNTKALILVAATLLTASCGEPTDSRKVPGQAAEKGGATARPAPRAAEPIGWDSSRDAFILNGQPLLTEKQWTFTDSVQGFAGAGTDVSLKEGGGLHAVGTRFDPIIRSPRNLNINGATSNAILVRITRQKNSGHWDGSIFYNTAGHQEVAGFAVTPSRGANPAVGETTIMVYDLTKPVKVASDWQSSVITGFRLDLDDDVGGDFVIHEIAIVSIPAPAPGGAALKP